MRDDPGFEDLLEAFFLEAEEQVEDMEALLLSLEAGGRGSEEIEQTLVDLKRDLHTLKGNSGIVGFLDLQRRAHQMEDTVARTKDAELPVGELLGALDELREELTKAHQLENQKTPPTRAASPALGLGRGAGLRVPFQKLDALVELQNETLILRTRLNEALRLALDSARRGDSDREALQREKAWEEVEGAWLALEKNLRMIQKSVSDLTLVPMERVLRPLVRLVRDEARRANKHAELVVHGGETRIDKSLLEVVADALGHLVRNAVVHGVEEPEQRKRAGKRATGRIGVEAGLDGQQVRVVVSDDGGGIDTETLLRRAAQLGLTDDLIEPASLIFHDGLSTSEKVHLGAGRGVALGAVKEAIEDLGGSILVHSERHVGTSFTLLVPVTASVLRAMLLEVDGQRYALPLSNVVLSQRLEPGHRHLINQIPVVRWRGALLPLLDLGLAFGTSAAARELGYLVVVQGRGRQRALVVDEVVDIRDIVVKTFDDFIAPPRGISGTTILADGQVLMILDANGLFDLSPVTGRASYGASREAVLPS